MPRFGHLPPGFDRHRRAIFCWNPVQDVGDNARNAVPTLSLLLVGSFPLAPSICQPGIQREGEVLLFGQAGFGQGLKEPVDGLPGCEELRVEMAHRIGEIFRQLDKVAVDIPRLDKAGHNMVGGKEAMMIQPWPQDRRKDDRPPGLRPDREAAYSSDLEC